MLLDVDGAGKLQDLLGAEWTIIATANGATDDEISAYYTGYYGLAAGGIDNERTLLGGASGGARVGILNQGAFLSRFATATGSNPVQRGVAVMRRVACLDLPDPVELDINVIPPVPDPNTPRTTRELYAAHATDALCRACHRSIDNFGFAFEQYDGMGALPRQPPGGRQDRRGHRDASRRHRDHRGGYGHRPRRRLRRQQCPGARPGHAAPPCAPAWPARCSAPRPGAATPRRGAPRTTSWPSGGSSPPISRAT